MRQLDPELFVDVVSKELGADFANKIRLDSQLELIVAYLAEEVPTQISYRKLELALTQSERDQPLRPAGADEADAYMAARKNELE